MKKFKTYQVDTFLLTDSWIEQGERGRISYVIRGGNTEKIHKEYVEKFKKKLLNENEENYTRWIFTNIVFQNIGGIDPYCSVMQFRIRDSY